MIRPGPRNLVTDVPGVLVGQAQDHRLRTGVSVLTSAAGLVAGVHVMGGAPGTRETDALAPDRLVQEAHAVVLSGGSAFGLDAAGGVMEALRAAGRGFAVGPLRVPIVPAAILFDLLAGGAPWDEPPWRALGRAAYDAAGEAFALGTAGAGTGATTGDLKGGLGSASAVLPTGVAGGATVGALVAVNAVGSCVVSGGPRFHAAPWEMAGEFGGLGIGAPDPAALPPPSKGRGQATTIAVVATDAALTQSQATRLAVMAHDGIARAVVPAHSPLDGDAVFAVSTGARALADPLADLFALGHVAATCLSRAIARGVYEATGAAGDPLPAWGDLFR